MNDKETAAYLLNDLEALGQDRVLFYRAVTDGHIKSKKPTTAMS